ncbi:MAG: hypothetical protein ACRD9L_08905, partial [Bryobacteraceae bacterium]
TNLFVEEIDGRKPRVYMWTFSIQKSLGKDWLLEAAYVGSHGRRLSKRYNGYSNVTPGVLYDVTPGVATRYPQLGQMLYSSQSGWSDFNALNLKLERRFNNGFQLLMAETWAKSIDTDSAGSYGSPNLNPANFQLDKGPSDFDIRHRFVTSVVYELPFGHGKKFLTNAGRAVDLVAGASILGLGYVMPIIYLTWSWFKGPIAPPNPWNAKGLEWERSPSPPPTFNFDKVPVVTEEAYNYANEPEVHVAG